MNKFKYNKPQRIIHDGEFIQAALIIACAWDKLSWAWLWGVVIVFAIQG